jgi:hypothetical protein
VHAVQHEKPDDRENGEPEDGRAAQCGQVDGRLLQPPGSDRLGRIIGLAQRTQEPFVELEGVAFEHFAGQVHQEQRRSQ